MESNVMKKCQFCKEDILFEAEVCKYCNRSQIDNEKVDKIIDDLSQKKYRTIFMITVFIAFSYSWWMSIIAIIIIIVISALISVKLSNLSMLKLLEKHKSYMKFNIIRNIGYYLVWTFIIFWFLGTYVYK